MVFEEWLQFLRHFICAGKRKWHCCNTAQNHRRLGQNVVGYRLTGHAECSGNGRMSVNYGLAVLSGPINSYVKPYFGRWQPVSPNKVARHVGDNEVIGSQVPFTKSGWCAQQVARIEPAGDVALGRTDKVTLPKASANIAHCRPELYFRHFVDYEALAGRFPLAAGGFEGDCFGCPFAPAFAASERALGSRASLRTWSA